MEEEEKKPSLPIKTKIAVYLMIIGGLEPLFFSVSLGGIDPFMASLGLLFLFFLFFLVRKRKWAWYGSVVVNFLLISLSLIPFLFSTSEERQSYVIVVFSVILLPCVILYLLFQDRKNFWKIAS